MEIALSIGAILLSLASLGWQAFTWTRSGPRPAIEGTLTLARGEHAELKITVSNKGRAACQVTDLAIRSTTRGHGLKLTKQYGTDGRELPIELAGAHSVNLHFDATDIASSLHHHRALSDHFNIVATLGDGTSRTSDGALGFVDCLVLGEVSQREHKTVVRRVHTTSRRSKRPNRSR